jgi:hypothetical protein
LEGRKKRVVTPRRILLGFSDFWANKLHAGYLTIHHS